MDGIVAPPPSPGLVPGPAPTFSVIIAAFQAAAVVGRAVTSALEQVPPPMEVVVCDDGSTDDIEGALAPFGDRVRLLRADHGGEASAKNHAIAAAQGEFVVVLDADDIFLPGRLEALGSLAAARPDLDLLTTDAYLTVGGRILGHCYHEHHRFAADDQRVAILRNNFIFGLVAVRRTRMLDAGGFDTNIGYTTDWDCWIRLIYAGVKVGLVNRPLAHYQLSETSMSAKRLAMAEGRVATLTKTAARTDLDQRERRVLDETLAAERRRVALESVKAALRSDSGQARRMALRSALSTANHPKLRLKLALTAAAPGVAARRQRRDEDRYWTAVGDVKLPRRPAGDVEPAGSGDVRVPQRSPATSLIIASRNRPAQLLQAVESVLAGDKVPTELVVIDQSDAPHPSLGDLGRQGACDVRYLWRSARGVSLGRNTGLAAARHDVLAFTDDDVVVKPAWFGALVRALVEAGPRSVVVGPVLAMPTASPGMFAPSTIADEVRAVYEGRAGHGRLYTGNMALFRSAFDEVGNFDERLGPGTPFPAAEDNDFGYRLLERGYRIVYDPDAALYHDSWRAEGDLLKLRWAYARGQGAYYAKYWSLRDRYMLRRTASHAKDHAVQAVRTARHRQEALAHAAYAVGLVVGATGWLWRSGWAGGLGRSASTGWSGPSVSSADAPPGRT